MAILLVRHATAGSRSRWQGEDRLRPLDKRGRRQAVGLAELLAGYGVTRIASSPYTRCLQTVAPLATRLEIEAEWRPELAEGVGAGTARELLRRLAAETAVACTHGDVIAGLLGPDRQAKKGAVWVLEPDGDRFVPTAYLPPPRS